MLRFSLLVAAALGCMAQPIPVPGGRLKVIAEGPVIARGQDRADAQVHNSKRITSLHTMARGSWTLLYLTGQGDNTVELAVPRRLERLVVTTQRGFLEAYDLNGSVEMDTSSGRIQLDRIGRDASATTGGGPIRVGTVRGTLRCASGGGTIQVTHAGGETWCETAGGEIYVGEVGGPLHAVTAGNVQVGRAHGSVAVRSDGGLIEVNEARGRVIAQTGGGSIEVGSSQGVSCESAVGAIRLKAVDGPVRAYTAYGSILAELLPGARTEESSLNTARGDITVFIPSNMPVSVQAFNRANGSRGRIVSDFSEIHIRADVDRRGPAMAEGVLNGGGPVLRISAAGNVYLRRSK